MSRHSTAATSYNHKIKFNKTWGDYRLTWTVDRYYAGSRSRFPRTMSRDANETGAKKFAVKHGIQMPEVAV